MTNVVRFPGTALVGVLVKHDEFVVMLAKPGAISPSRQCSHDTLEDAEASAREGAEMCGWRYIGIFDQARLDRIAEFSERGRAASLPADDDDPGPAAA